jgi:molybdate transport system substrate-binding protein
MEKLGLADSIKDRTVRHRDAQVQFTYLLAGKGREIGFGGLTEIVRWRDKGLRLAGPLPPDIQNYTVYAATLAAEPQNPDGARRVPALSREPRRESHSCRAGRQLTASG